MRQRAVGMVHIERAAWAALLPVGSEHEVVNDELASTLEKIRERYFPMRPVEHVILLDLYPGKLSPFSADSIFLTREFLFFL
jgi:hypothetical protein